jgi:hypothetical protein
MGLRFVKDGGKVFEDVHEARCARLVHGDIQAGLRRLKDSGRDSNLHPEWGTNAFVARLRCTGVAQPGLQNGERSSGPYFTEQAAKHLTVDQAAA